MIPSENRDWYLSCQQVIGGINFLISVCLMLLAAFAAWIWMLLIDIVLPYHESVARALLAWRIGSTALLVVSSVLLVFLTRRARLFAIVAISIELLWHFVAHSGAMWFVRGPEFIWTGVYAAMTMLTPPLPKILLGYLAAAMFFLLLPLVNTTISRMIRPEGRRWRRLAA